MPVIAPARNAMVRPPCRLVRAASAVRTFAFTETFMPMKPVDAREERADHEADRRDDAEEVADQRRDDHADDGDGAILAGEIGAGAFLHGVGDVLHPLVAGGRLEHLHDRDEAVKHGQQAAAYGDIDDNHRRNPSPELDKWAQSPRTGAPVWRGL